MISFLVQVSQYTPDPFPLGDSRRLVAPFWADVDTRNGGQVFYRETTDSQLLKRATNDVSATFVDHKKNSKPLGYSWRRGMKWPSMVLGISHTR